MKRTALSAKNQQPKAQRITNSEQRKKRTTNNQNVPKLPHILQPSLRNLFGTGALAIGKRPWGNAIGIDRY
ncbi:hypothetical protein [Maribacter sp. 1_MG-2023]|uniref:hypothetical protein n=1 Tax=Maribacter sp. 1_MG-2023 TaxID=3062677 RepID=UPI0026E37989|nr:hypothetical protein [Maribacter sp. 1_MG-2023]MDO6470722.1 hypothetical protein [Maribacter sp. 1_MG-2023]